jgi:hypothetical protein
MDHPQTPRILAPHLSNFQHRIVRILGKVVQLRGETAIIDAGGHVDLILNRVRCFLFLEKILQTKVSYLRKKLSRPVGISFEKYLKLTHE